MDRYYNFINMLLLKKNIVKLFEKSWNKVDFSKFENKIIEEYLTDGIDFLNKNIAPTLTFGGYKTTFSGVFLHQTPKINRLDHAKHCSKNINCEFGDLLILFYFLDRNDNILLNRAMVSQAKKEHKIDNFCQKCLYDYDTRFEWATPKNIYINSPLNSVERKLPSFYFYNRSKSMKYLILQKQSTHSCPYFINSPWDKQTKVNFDNFMFSFIIGLDGLRFSRKPKWNGGWSTIIWELLDTTAKQVTSFGFKRGKYLPKNIQFLLSEITENENYLIDVPSNICNDNYGMNLLFITVKDFENG